MIDLIHFDLHINPSLKHQGFFGIETCVDQILTDYGVYDDEAHVRFQIRDDGTDHLVRLKVLGLEHPGLNLMLTIYAERFNLTQFLIDTGHNVGVYRHSQNGDKEPVEETFDNFIGCNGVIDIGIKSPFAVWLLHHVLY